MAIDDGDPTYRNTQGTAQIETKKWSPPAGYEVSEVLGRGGMGEVVLAYDTEIGRGVAIKHMLDASSEVARERFLREAKIQARLDHPAIVPVYELGRDYFTMKRLAGTTLLDVIVKGSATRQRMLRAFVDVCLAVELAHSRGVVHRDLKPANIMLGDFGEVYVLDWGIAKLVDEPETPRAQTLDLPSSTHATRVGKVLGTPEFMAPEALLHGVADRRTDVYALGIILDQLLLADQRDVAPEL